MIGRSAVEKKIAERKAKSEERGERLILAKAITRPFRAFLKIKIILVDFCLLLLFNEYLSTTFEFRDSELCRN